MTVSRSIARWSARLESHLSTHAFTHLFLVFYAATVFLMFFWGSVGEWNYQTYEAQTGDVMRWFISIARGAGYSLNLNTAFVILLAARLIFTWLRDTPLNKILPLDKAFPRIHIIAGYTIAVSVVVHGVFHMVWIVGWDGWSSGLWGITMSVVTGFTLLTVFAIMLFFARPSVRQNNFRLFYMVHIVGAVLFFGLLIFHGMYRMRPETYKYVTPALIVYIIDRLLRRFKIRTAHLELSADNSVFKDDKVLELRIPRPFKFQSGQYAEIMVPSINKEWHPFTIASGSHEETMNFYIKALGDWTNTLHNAFQQRLDGNETEPIKVRVRGPFGAPAQHVGGYERVVLISGGIGATPFSAICKDLHQLNKATNKEAVVPPKSDLSSAEKRLNKAFSEFYDVDIGKAGDIEDEQRSVYVSDMLQMTASHRNLRHRGANAQQEEQAEQNLDFEAVVVDDASFSSSNSQSSSMDAYLTAEAGSSGRLVSNAQKKANGSTSGDSFFNRSSLDRRRKAHQSIAQLYARRARLLAFLHTTRVNFVLLLSLVVRMVIICVGSILKSDFVSLKGYSGEAVGLWVAIADVCLNFLFVAVLPLTIFLEISFMGLRFFRTVGRCVDFFAFLPLTILVTALGIKTWVSGEPEGTVLMLLHYLLFIPLMFVLLAFRMYRSIGSRSLLSDGECLCERHKRVPDVDFVWTTPLDADDAWLRNELEPLADGSDLRLHRYVTREKEEDLELGDGHITTRTGRPDWEEVFDGIVRTTRSGSMVGVFFCGPHVMGDAVREAMRKVEIVSHLRGAYLASVDEKVIMEDVSVGQEAVQRLREAGCSVRFVFREENFG